MTVFLVIKQSMRDCEPDLRIRVFDTYDKAATYSRALIDEAINEWQHDVGTLLKYDSNRDYQDDDVLVEKYDNGNACNIFVYRREYENSDSIYISKQEVE